MNTFQKMIGASLLIVSLSVAYYFVIYTPKKEGAIIELQKQVQLKKEQAEQKKEQDALSEKTRTKELLDSCLSNAETNYSNYWTKECKSRGLLSESCLNLLDMSLEDYYKDQNISSSFTNEAMNARIDAMNTYYKKRENCSCMLPAYISDTADKYRTDSKNECFRKYPQN